LQKKNMLANFQRILHPVELFTQKIVTMLWKIWVWDPGSEIREIRDPEKNLFRIPDPGVKKAQDPGSATLLCENRYCQCFKSGFTESGRHFAESVSGFGSRPKFFKT
jgi:hypothetical protein